jgi:hypothetical protein
MATFCLRAIAPDPKLSPIMRSNSFGYNRIIETARCDAHFMFMGECVVLGTLDPGEYRRMQKMVQRARGAGVSPGIRQPGDLHLPVRQPTDLTFAKSPSMGKYLEAPLSTYYVLC